MSHLYFSASQEHLLPPAPEESVPGLFVEGVEVKDNASAAYKQFQDSIYSQFAPAAHTLFHEAQMIDLSGTPELTMEATPIPAHSPMSPATYGNVYSYPAAYYFNHMISPAASAGLGITFGNEKLSSTVLNRPIDGSLHLQPVMNQVQSNFSFDMNALQTMSMPNSESEQKIFTCSFSDCKEEFTNSRSLRKHMNLHQLASMPYETEGKSFCCSSCSQKFRRLPDLQRHFKSVHSDAKPFVCPKGCGKSFSRKDALKRHLECKSNAPCAGLRRAGSIESFN